VEIKSPLLEHIELSMLPGNVNSTPQRHASSDGDRSPQWSQHSNDCPFEPLGTRNLAKIMQRYVRAREERKFFRMFDLHRDNNPLLRRVVGWIVGVVTALALLQVWGADVVDLFHRSKQHLGSPGLPAAWFEALLDEFHITHLRNASAISLSGGERRRCPPVRGSPLSP